MTPVAPSPGLLASVALLLVACDPGRGELCAPDRVCASASPEVCAAGPEATLYGRATFVAVAPDQAGGTCAATSDATCAAAELTCRLWGQCSAPSASASGGCDAAADKDRDFLASRNVACGAGRTCVATRDADCRAAEVCRLEGRCTARAGVCVAADAADCKAAVYCPELGWCSLVGDRCTAKTADDCKPSRACDDWGECGVDARGDGCTSCARSRGCSEEGLCQRVLSADTCRAVEDADCRRAAACKTGGRCRASQGACVK